MTTQEEYNSILTALESKIISLDDSAKVLQDTRDILLRKYIKTLEDRAGVSSY